MSRWFGVTAIACEEPGTISQNLSPTVRIFRPFCFPAVKTTSPRSSPFL
jgi:hypothetical protein